MPACFISLRRSAAWSGSMTVTTVPPAPARAVRPERCRYALCSVGGSRCTTSSTSSTWMPRAAMSVATSTFATAGGEGGQVALAGVLRQVAVQVDRRDAVLGQCGCPLLGAVLGPGEQHPAAAAGGEFADDLGAVLVAHREDVVLHGFHR